MNELVRNPDSADLSPKDLEQARRSLAHSFVIADAPSYAALASFRHNAEGDRQALLSLAPRLDELKEKFAHRIANEQYQSDRNAAQRGLDALEVVRQVQAQEEGANMMNRLDLSAGAPAAAAQILTAQDDRLQQFFAPEQASEDAPAQVDATRADIEEARAEAAPAEKSDFEKVIESDPYVSLGYFILGTTRGARERITEHFENKQVPPTTAEALRSLDAVGEGLIDGSLAFSNDAVISLTHAVKISEKCADIFERQNAVTPDEKTQIIATNFNTLALSLGYALENAQMSEALVLSSNLLTARHNHEELAETPLSPREAAQFLQSRFPDPADQQTFYEGLKALPSYGFDDYALSISAENIIRKERALFQVAGELSTSPQGALYLGNDLVSEGSDATFQTFSRAGNDAVREKLLGFEADFADVAALGTYEQYKRFYAQVFVPETKLLRSALEQRFVKEGGDTAPVADLLREISLNDHVAITSTIEHALEAPKTKESRAVLKQVGDFIEAAGEARFARSMVQHNHYNVEVYEKLAAKEPSDSQHGRLQGVYAADESRSAAKQEAEAQKADAAFAALAALSASRFAAAENTAKNTAAETTAAEQAVTEEAAPTRSLKERFGDFAAVPAAIKNTVAIRTAGIAAALKGYVPTKLDIAAKLKGLVPAKAPVFAATAAIAAFGKKNQHFSASKARKDYAALDLDSKTDREFAKALEVLDAQRGRDSGYDRILSARVKRAIADGNTGDVLPEAENVNDSASLHSLLTDPTKRINIATLAAIGAKAQFAPTPFGLRDELVLGIEAALAELVSQKAASKAERPNSILGNIGATFTLRPETSQAIAGKVKNFGKAVGSAIGAADPSQPRLAHKLGAKLSESFAPVSATLKSGASQIAARFAADPEKAAEKAAAKQAAQAAKAEAKAAKAEANANKPAVGQKIGHAVVGYFVNEPKHLRPEGQKWQQRLSQNLPAAFLKVAGVAATAGIGATGVVQAAAGGLVLTTLGAGVAPIVAGAAAMGALGVGIGYTASKLTQYYYDLKSTEAAMNGGSLLSKDVRSNAAENRSARKQLAAAAKADRKQERADMFAAELAKNPEMSGLGRRKLLASLAARDLVSKLPSRDEVSAFWASDRRNQMLINGAIGVVMGLAIRGTYAAVTGDVTAAPVLTQPEQVIQADPAAVIPGTGAASDVPPVVPDYQPPASLEIPPIDPQVEAVLATPPVITVSPTDFANSDAFKPIEEALRRAQELPGSGRSTDRIIDQVLERAHRGDLTAIKAATSMVSEGGVFDRDGKFIDIRGMAPHPEVALPAQQRMLDLFGTSDAGNPGIRQIQRDLPDMQARVARIEARLAARAAPRMTP